MDEPTLSRCVVKTAVVHTVTYTLCGMVAFEAMDYPSLFLAPGLRTLMRPTDDAILIFGPVYQVVRGALFGVVFHALREVLFVKPRGALRMWMMLVTFGIFGTFGPTPGSLEGLFYTVVPVRAQLRGLPEVLTQSLLLSVVLVHWVRHPDTRWLRFTLWGLFVLACTVPLLALVAR